MKKHILSKMETTYGTDMSTVKKAPREVAIKAKAVRLKDGELQAPREITVEANIVCPCCNKTLSVKIIGDLPP